MWIRTRSQNLTVLVQPDCAAFFALQGASWSVAIRLAAEAFMKFEAPGLSAKRLQDKFEKSESPKDLLTKSRSRKKFLADKGVDVDSLSYNECTGIIITVWTEPAFDCCSSAWQVKNL